MGLTICSATAACEMPAFAASCAPCLSHESIRNTRNVPAAETCMPRALIKLSCVANVREDTFGRTDVNAPHT